MTNEIRGKIKPYLQIGGGAKQKRVDLVFITVAFFFSLILIPSLVQAGTITANVTETNINSTVLLTGAGFSASTNYYLIPQLENKSAWWDGYDENWFFSTQVTNNTIYVTTDGSGNFNYNLYIPNDWRVSGGKVSFKVGEQVASSLLWSTQGRNWVATQPTKNGITGDSDPNGFVYTATTVGVANQGGIEKFYKSNGTSPCNWSDATVETITDLTNNGSVLYAVTAVTTNNLRRINMADCSLIGSQTTAGVAAYSVNVAPDNTYIIITYGATATPRMYNITNATPIYVSTFANNTALPAFIAYDSCISPDSNTIYVGYANGNVTAQNKSGYVLWNKNPVMEELRNSGYAFPVNGLSCDNERVYVARSSVVLGGITNQGFVEALWATNGSRAWVNSKTDTIYDNMDVGNIKCDNDYCYAVKMITPAPVTGIVGSAIVQINKTTGNVNWKNWRSYLPTTYNGVYGAGATHSSAQTLWADTNTNGYIYPVYTNGWVQKIAKNDVNAVRIETNLWIRGSTNYWDYVFDVPKNIFLSNETPYYTFRHWNQQGRPLNTSDSNKLMGTYSRFSNLNTFNSFTATETAPSLFINPVIQTAVTQENRVYMFNNSYQTTCPATRYGPTLYGWHYVDRSCHYEEVPARNASFNIGTTINGTFITGIVYSLIKTKFWDDYPITKYYGKDNWAWASMHNTANNQVLGFATKFGNDQEDVYSDIYGRAVLFYNNAAGAAYYRPQFRADLNRKTDNYIFFMPKTPDGNNSIGEHTMWRRIDIETQKIANPINITLSNDESGSFNIGAYTYAQRIPLTAQEPNLFNRTNEPVEIIFNATGGIRTDCQDVIITDDTDTPISLWQVDNSSACSMNNNVSVWIMMNWNQSETKNLRLYYNSSSATPVPLGTTDLVVTNLSGSCGGNNQEVNFTSTNWYNWQRPGAATAANEITKFGFNDTSANMWGSATHWQVASCYKNSNTAQTGVGLAADSCGTAAAVVSRCLQTGATGKIFAKLNATVAMGAIAGRPAPASTLNVEYYFFANSGRIRIRTQLNQSLPMMNTTVSKNWPPYYYFSIANLIPGSTTTGINSWIYYSGLYEQMKRPVATFNADQTEANISASPLPLMFTIKYGGMNNISQTNGSIYRPSTVDGTNNFWEKGCTAHKIWQYYNYAPLGATYGAAATPVYTSEFISCDKSLASQLPQMGQSGYVNLIPEMGWDGTSVNRWYDFTLIGKYYMMPNSYRPYNRDNRLLGPYATATGVAGDSTPYSTSARISSYIIPVCPEKEYGYKGYDDFLTDLPNLIEDTSIHVKTNTNNIPCATQVIKFTDQRGSDGINIIFARNLSVIVGEIVSPGITYPFNTFASGTYGYQVNASLDLTFVQKASATAGYFGKYYFTYTPDNQIIHAFATSGNPQFMLAGTPSTQLSATATMYTTRYAFAPEAGYTKDVFDESALWDKTSQNFNYYRNPCWLGSISSLAGSTETGHTFLVTNSTPGWQHANWGLAYNTPSVTCPRNTYNMELDTSFRPTWGSSVPTAAAGASWNEMMINGRQNKNGTGTPPGAEDTYYVARHNSLFDYKHSDDFNSVLQDTSELNQNEKHPNKQPWYCQISRHTNRSFCVMTSSLSTLIYNYAPGQGLTATQDWSPYWSSLREASTFRKYFVSRYGDASAWLWSYDNVLDVTLYPSLARSEVLSSNLLYASNNADDYSSFFNKQFPTASSSLMQSQFLLKDWKNTAFIVFDSDSRHYAPGLPMSINGIAIKNGELLTNSNISLGIYSSNDVLVQSIATTTNSSGMFNWTLTLSEDLTPGLNYVRFDYNNSEVREEVPFRAISLTPTIVSDQAAYEQGNDVATTITITNSYTSANTDPDQLKLRYLNPSSSVVECAKYPASADIPGCNDNVLNRTETGVFTYTFSIGSNPLGVYTQRATVTEDGIAADFDRGFVVALIDPCKPNSAFDYALSYPIEYHNVTDVLTVIGNSTFGTSSNPITTEQMYTFAQATRGTCIIEKPATGTYTIKSQLVIGNGTQEVYVSSKGESVGFTTENMPQLFIDKYAHLTFGGIADGISQEGSSVKFTSNQSDDILLDVAGGELAFYDSYVGDVGSAWGRFIYRGSCGVLDEESSDANSSITIKKTIFDRAARGQFFYTSNVTIDDMKVNRINSSASNGYGIVSGCSLPVLNNLQIYHQAQTGSGISVSERTPNNTDLVVQNSFLDYNVKDVIANKDGKGVKLVNTQWDRTYGFNWTGDWSGTTTIQESYGYLPNFIDTSSQGVENLTIVLIDRLGNVQVAEKTDSLGEINEQYIKTWQVEKTDSGETITLFNPYTFYGKKYGKKLISEPKSFSTRTVETKQVLGNSFTTKAEAQASALKNITYNAPTKVAYGEEYNSTWTTSGQLAHYPVDSCQYFALFANETKLAEGADYTIDYETGEITFLEDISGNTIYPVYFYGGDVTITNGFTIMYALSMNDIYDYLQYQTSQNNLTEDVYTVDGLTYTFCVNLVVGDATRRGSLSDSDASLTFKEGYDLSFDGLGGFVDLAGINAGGGSGGSGGLPLNIFDDIGTSYAPGNNAYLFSTVMNSQGTLVDASVSVSVYYPNGSLYTSGSSTQKSTGRFEYGFSLPGDAALGTWLATIDASYTETEVHDNVAFMVSAGGVGGGSGNGSLPLIQIDAPSIIDINNQFGIAAFAKNANGLLVNCDSPPLLTLKDLINGTNILDGVSMSSLATGQYNYTASVSSQSTFLALVSCSISSTTYVSNPKIISSQNVPTNNTGGGGGSAYPTIELLASTPIKTSTIASIGALVKSSSGIATNCDDNLGITMRNLADGTSSSGEMSNFGTGMYNYSWITPATASVFYINASCSISGTDYIGFTIISTQDVGATATIDYNQIAQYVWNFTSRNLTYYNQSVAESMQNCLQNGECSGWWLNTTLTNIHNTINTINTTANQIKTNTETIMSYFNCTSANEVCTRLQNILNNATDIQSRVYSLNTSQIPNLQNSIDDVYIDTQYIRTNMATASALVNIQNNITWLVNNVATQSNISSITNQLSNLQTDIDWLKNNTATQQNITDLFSRLIGIDNNLTDIRTMLDCSNPANSDFCNYLNSINTTVNYVKENMATYSQVEGVQNNVTWLMNNVATQEAMANNFTEVISRLTIMNSTLLNVHDDLVAVNGSLADQITNAQNDITWIKDNVATSAEINSNFTESFNLLSQINATVSNTNIYLYGEITNRLTELNTTAQDTYSYILNNVSTQASVDIISQNIDLINSNVNIIQSQTNCSNPSNSDLCTYLSNMNITINSVYSEMATYSQVSGLQSNVSWIKDNIVTQSAFESNMTDIRSRLTEMNTTIDTTYDYLTVTITDNLNYINQTTITIRDEARANNLSIQEKIDNLQSNITWLINNVATLDIINANFTDLRDRLNEINNTLIDVRIQVNCSSPSNSDLCTYLNSINTTANSVYSEMATQALLQQVALNVSYIRDNMATYSQVQGIQENVSWIKDNVATQEAMANNFTDIKEKLTNMNTTLWDVHDDLIIVNTSLANQVSNIQNDITWIKDNVATQEQINNNFSDVFARLVNINTTVSDTNNYLYGTIINALSEINSTNQDLSNYVYNQITDSLNQINLTTQDSYLYMLNNLSVGTNLTEVLDKLDALSGNLTFVKNNMFYQGNATGAFLVDYLSSVYAEQGSVAELWVITSDLLGNAKTVSAAECQIEKAGTFIENATTIISNSGIYSYWDISQTQTTGVYYFNCTLTGSTLNLKVPFFVGRATTNFEISSLVSASPKYPNENAVIEATFTNQNGSVEPDTINMSILKPNYLTVWYTANKNDFSNNNGIWSWVQMIEASPTTGTYYVQMTATYNGTSDSRTTQFRIATGGPYKVYLDCPTTSNIGQNLVCSVILKDEGEAATESISTIWVDTNNNGVLDVGEPQASFSKRTTPLQNVTEPVSVNIPSSYTAGFYIVRVSTSYVNSAQPNSEASDSVTLQTSGTGGDNGGGTGGGSGGSSGSGGTGITGKTIIRPENLMDVLVKTLEDYRVVAPGEKIMAEITFLNLGTEEIKDAVFTYCINNNNNNIGQCIKETVAVQTKVQLVRKIVLPTTMEDGTYYFDVKVDYMNETVESRDTFEVVSGGKSTHAPNQEIFNIKLSKSYLIIGVISLASIILLVLILTVIFKRKKKSQKVAIVESKLQHLKELKAKGEISERTYHTEREKLLQKIRAVFNGKTMSIILSGISLIAIAGMLTTNKAITGYAIGESALTSSGSFIYLILLICSLGLLMFIHRQKIKTGIEVIKEKSRKKYPKNSINGLINKKVYSESGHYLGKINDIILGENRIESLKIEIDKKHEFKAKGIIVDYKQVKSVSEIVIIDGKVTEHLEKL